MSAPSSPLSPQREVHCADALPWLADRPALPATCVITSLPDVSEVGLTLDAWRAWFKRAALLSLAAAPDAGATLFYQSDIKKDGEWVDKAQLVHEAARENGARCLFHKLVCRRPPGTLTYGRPGYTHFLAFSRQLACPDMLPIPDVITDPGEALWVRAMGVKAAAYGVWFAREVVQAQTVLDPFCGVGTVLAVANALGLRAIGVEKARKRAAHAQALALPAGALAGWQPGPTP